MKGLSQARARKQGPRVTLGARGTGSVGDSVGEGRLSCCHVVHRFGVDGGYIVDIFGRDCVYVLLCWRRLLFIVLCVIFELNGVTSSIQWCHIIHSLGRDCLPEEIASWCWHTLAVSVGIH